MTRKILKHWALFYKNGERHFINAPTRAELDSAVFEWCICAKVRQCDLLCRV